MGKETKSKWLDKLLVFCKYLKKCSVCMFSVVMECFLKWGVEYTESNSLFSKFGVKIK